VILASEEPAEEAAATPLISFSNELKSLIETMEALLGKAVKVARRHKAGKAAASLDGLHFGPGGFRRALLNVADGRTTSAAIDALEVFYRETGPAVQQDIQSLREYREVVRKLCGASASSKLEEIIDGPNGKFAIRYEIEGLVHMARGGRCTTPDLQKQAAKSSGSSRDSTQLSSTFMTRYFHRPGHHIR
jgi:hypothetical protein